MQLSIRHTTQYAYDQPVTYTLQKVRLRPLTSDVQTVQDWSLQIDGGKVEASYTDHYGNHVDLVSADPGTGGLTLTASGTIDTKDAAGIFGKRYGRAPLWHFRQQTLLTKPGTGIRALSKALNGTDDMLGSLHEISAAILEAAPYRTGETQAETTGEEALKHGFGVCQDHSHIMIGAARQAGLPARYVSGYLMLDGQIDQDASHAWAEVHLDDLGWVGFDVSNGISPDERYVRIAIGRDAQDAAPISGLRMGPGSESLIVSLQVQQ
ncbi:transglutaminase family protein [Yoonia sp. SS1-5]|uniref:Transglutaminase family protein n=1 Tax=Yoonia rhodophyticola TaxID=3137370 RepID=A0AAN0NLH3_9RHOB